MDRGQHHHHRRSRCGHQCVPESSSTVLAAANAGLQQAVCIRSDSAGRQRLIWIDAVFSFPGLAPGAPSAGKKKLRFLQKRSKRVSFSCFPADWATVFTVVRIIRVVQGHFPAMPSVCFQIQDSFLTVFKPVTHPYWQWIAQEGCVKYFPAKGPEERCPLEGIRESMALGRKAFCRTASDHNLLESRGSDRQRLWS